MIHIIRDNSDNKDFQRLIQELDKDLNARYGKVQFQFDKYNKVENLDTVVIAFWQKKAVGCACFKVFEEDSIEIKRMFLIPKYRGQGIADKILEELENSAMEKGFSNAVLETGIKQPEAIGFYKRNNYIQINNYGQYIGNANSVCMKKQLKENQP